MCKYEVSKERKGPQDNISIKRFSLYQKEHGPGFKNGEKKNHHWLDEKFLCNLYQFHLYGSVMKQQNIAG